MDDRERITLALDLHQFVRGATPVILSARTIRYPPILDRPFLKALVSPPGLSFWGWLGGRRLLARVGGEGAASAVAAWWL